MSKDELLQIIGSLLDSDYDFSFCLHPRKACAWSRIIKIAVYTICVKDD